MKAVAQFASGGDNGCVGSDCRFPSGTSSHGSNQIASEGLEGFDRLPRGYYAKIAVESVIAGLLLAMLAVPLAVISLAIVIDSPGPVFFRQLRFGMGGKPFWLLKFRTMAASQCDPLGRLQTRADDSRITRVGRVLRMSSLDELPQLVNILRGEMALIGPRAHPCALTVEGNPCEEIVPTYLLRHRVRPGLTGFAQVNGSRGALYCAEALRERVILDNYYIDNWSPLLDLRIFVRTFGVVLGCTGR